MAAVAPAVRPGRAVTTWIAGAAVLLLVALAVVLVVDRGRKHVAIVAAHQQAWLCSHRGTNCGGRDPRAIESAWHGREQIYGVVGGLLGATLLVAGGVTARRTLRARR